ncbi:MAG: hypothetical protein JNN17_03450 [Verrucomicrobiaceae bacterium]|nr:hypothetical protein [Verrucomicrobiaceae bacterium]
MKRVSAGDEFVCRWDTCRGKALLRGEYVEQETPFWAKQSFLASLAGLFAMAFVAYVFLRPAPPQPPVQVSVTIPPGSIQVVNNTKTQEDETSAKKPIETPPSPNPQFEVETLVACADRILSQFRNLHIARATSSTKFLNGQRQTAIDRTADEALEQIKLTYQQEKLFEDKAKEIEGKIEAELTSYMSCMERMKLFTSGAVSDAFEAVTSQRAALPTSRSTPVGLAQQHWSKHMTREQIKSSFEQHSE